MNDFRIFDRNKDGFINKKEFKMMTTASKFSMKKIETVFAVSSIIVKLRSRSRSSPGPFQIYFKSFQSI